MISFPRTFANLTTGILSYLDDNFNYIKGLFGAANGFATLNVNSKVVEDPASAGSGNGLDADTVDTFHASQTPGANTIPVTDSSGKLPIGLVQGTLAYEEVTGSDATTTGQSLVTITGLSIALEANSEYTLEAHLVIGTSSPSTAGNKYGVNYDVSGGSIEGAMFGAGFAGSLNTDRLNALNSPSSAYITSAGATGSLHMFARVKTGANAGNLTIQHLKVTSGTSTVFQGSYMVVTKR